MSTKLRALFIVTPVIGTGHEFEGNHLGGKAFQMIDQMYRFCLHRKLFVPPKELPKDKVQKFRAMYEFLNNFSPWRRRMAFCVYREKQGVGYQWSLYKQRLQAYGIRKKKKSKQKKAGLPYYTATLGGASINIPATPIWAEPPAPEGLQAAGGPSYTLNPGQSLLNGGDMYTNHYNFPVVITHTPNGFIELGAAPSNP